MIQAKNYIL